MARTYTRPPGITVTEETQTSINPLIATPDLLCLVGPATGTVTANELVGPLTTTSVTATGTAVADPAVQTITVSDATNIKVGQIVEGTGFSFDPASPTKVTAVSGTTVTLNKVLTASITTSTAYFNDVFTLNGLTSKDTMTDASIAKISAPDSSVATTANASYTSNSGYIDGSYFFNKTDHTIARKALIPTAKLSAVISDSATMTGAGVISVYGNPNLFATTGTVGIGSEQFTYTGKSVPSDEFQTITITGTATSGTFTLSFNNQTTDAITFTSGSAPTATQIKNALAGLSTIGTGNVDVTGTAGAGPWTVEFKGALVGDVPQLTATGTLTTGGTSTITTGTTTPGAFNLTGCTRNVNGTVKSVHNLESPVTRGFTIPNNNAVSASYTYTPENYYKPYEATGSNFTDISNRFGDAFESDGVTVNSPLTLAAQIAIENGANRFLLQPLFYTTDLPSTPMVTRNQPTNAQAVLPATWESTFASLRGSENIGVIVPVVGQTHAYSYGSDASTALLNDATQKQIIQKLQQHIAYVSSENQQNVIGVFGEDSTDAAPDATTVATYPTYADRSVLINNMSVLQGYVSNNTSYNQQLVYVGQTKFKRASSTGGTVDAVLGGQYAAAAIAGMISSVNVSTSLTRRSVAGFKSISDTRTKAQKTADSGAKERRNNSSSSRSYNRRYFCSQG